MGGIGSGRSAGFATHTVVEDCLAMDFGMLDRRGCIVDGRRDVLSWTRHQIHYEPETIAIAGYKVEFRLDAGVGFVVTLVYRPETVDKVIQLPIRLSSRRSGCGGPRWFAICPLADARTGVGCNRRACKLYLPPHEIYFGCRACYGLSYWSQQSRNG